MEPITSWSELRVGRWYALPGVRRPSKLAGMSVSESEPRYRSLTFTDANGAGEAGYSLAVEAEPIKFIPVSSPLRRYVSNAVRQAAYRKRIKQDPRVIVHENDLLMLPMAAEDGTEKLVRFKVKSVPRRESDLRRGTGHKVRYADIRLERL